MNGIGNFFIIDSEHWSCIGWCSCRREPKVDEGKSQGSDDGGGSNGPTSGPYGPAGGPYGRKV